MSSAEQLEQGEQLERPRTLIIEADGGSRGNPGPAGYGALVRSGEQILAERAEFIGTATNNVAEYRGLIAGLRAAAQINPDALVSVRMDSKLVVEQMSGRWKIKHPDMRELALEAGRIFPHANVEYEWIPRAQNAAADSLANEAMDGGVGTVVQRDFYEVTPARPEADPGVADALFDVVSDVEGRIWLVLVTPGTDPRAVIERFDSGEWSHVPARPTAERVGTELATESDWKRELGRVIRKGTGRASIVTVERELLISVLRRALGITESAASLLRIGGQTATVLAYSPGGEVAEILAIGAPV